MKLEERKTQVLGFVRRALSDFGMEGMFSSYAVDGNGDVCVYLCDAKELYIQEDFHYGNSPYKLIEILVLDEDDDWTQLKGAIE